MTKKPRWLDRRIAAPGPYLTLCLFENEYRAAFKHLGVPPVGAWLAPGASATTHLLMNKGRRVGVVCIDGWQGRSPIEVAGLLVHEAVHVWQEYCDGIGERHPGSEQEAYGVQCIAQELMAEFARRVGQQ